MKSDRDLQALRPPRCAEWLFVLVMPVDSIESMLGDLAEEFSKLVLQSGLTVARQWYWRQTMRTVLDGIGDAFRSAPLLLLATTLAGWWSLGFATRWTAHLVENFLNAQKMYLGNPSAYLFWVKFPFEMGRGFLCLAIGTGVAVIAKGKEAVAVLTLVTLQVILLLLGIVALIARGHVWLHWFFDMLPWNISGFVATLLGGVIVRILRASHAKTARSSKSI